MVTDVAWAAAARSRAATRRRARRLGLALAAALLAVLLPPPPPAAASGWWEDGAAYDRTWRQGEDWAQFDTHFCVTSVIGGWAYLERWDFQALRWDRVQEQRLQGAVAGCQRVYFRFSLAEPEDAGRYRYVAWTGAGAGVWTETNAFGAYVRLSPPYVWQGPVDTSAWAGGTAVFSANAAAGVPPTPSPRWQTSRDGVRWTDVPGATERTWRTPVLAVEDDGLLVRAVYTRRAAALYVLDSDDVATAGARLTVLGPPAVVEHPADVSALPGEPVVLAARAEGPGAIWVRWQSLAPGAPDDAWADVPGATGATLTTVADTDAHGTRYRAVFRNGAGDSPSAPATLAVVVVPPVDLHVAPRTGLVDRLPGW